MASEETRRTPVLAPQVRSALDDEERLLERVRASLERAARRARPARRAQADEESLRSLREQAARASESDLPGLLHDLSVGQQLAARRTARRLPDPASPYIAHLRVDEGKGPIDYCLGHVSFFDSLHDVHVVDWRVAPVARIFYRYREGDRFEEEFPGRTADGVVLARRIVVIDRGALVRIVGDDLALEKGADGEWRESDRSEFSLQSGGAGTAARPGILGVGVGAAARLRPAVVTALLDPEQYAAISSPPERALLVLGSAGSGKTTVALHRLAHVTASHPARYPTREARVVVPEEGLARLSRRLLEPLGVDPSRVSTIDAWATSLSGQVFGRMRIAADTPSLVMSLKRHPALYRALFERFAEGDVSSVAFPRLRRALADAFADRAFLESVVEASAGDLPRTAVDETLRHTMLQLAEPIEDELASVDLERRRTLDGRDVSEGTADALAGTLDVEDLPILLALYARKLPLGVRPVSLLVLDEAEDFSLFELFVLGKLVREHASVTLAGDEAQQTASSFAGWETSLATIGAGGAATCRLPTSYRCPRPVTELARGLLGRLAPEQAVHAARDGAPVGVFRLASEAQAHLFLVGALTDLVAREPQASIGVIAATPEAARRFFALLGDVAEARLVTDGAFTFRPGIDVTDVDEVKGLEFDYVVVPDATAAAYPRTDDARRKLHVAVTRASHQLWVAAGGAASPLLDGV